MDGRNEFSFTIVLRDLKRRPTMLGALESYHYDTELTEYSNAWYKATEKAYALLSEKDSHWIINSIIND